MKVVIQRVKSASVTIDGTTVGKISRGLLVFVGVGKDDTTRDVDWTVDKVVHLRIFENEEGKFDRSLLDVDGDLLLVSQFTLYGDCSRGRRPSFSQAMEPGRAREFFDLVVRESRKLVRKVETGVFQASMDVSLVNEGPVTVLIDSR
jgi:D-aminoacyl-tRNA deacylase